MNTTDTEPFSKRKNIDSNATETPDLEVSGKKGTDPNTLNPKKDKIDVFVSHRHEDGKFAKDLKDKLELYCSDRLELHLSEEIPGGDEWLKQIKRDLDRADLMFFLYTEPSKDWDWCLWEAGCYEGKSGANRILVFIGEKEEPPEPLAHLQAIKVSRENARQFLMDFFGGTKYAPSLSTPLSKKLAGNRNDIQKIAELMYEGFIGPAGTPVEKTYFSKYLNIRLNDWSDLAHGASLDDAEVQSDQLSLDALFSLPPKPDGLVCWTWGDIKRQSQKGDDGKWTGELEQAVHDSKVAIPEALQSTFKPPGSETIYKPVLDRREISADGSANFRILFIKQLSRNIAKGPQALATLLSSLTLGGRLHWEVYDRYQHRIDRWPEKELPDGCKRILAAMDNVEQEAQFRKQAESDGEEQEGDRLLWAFPEKQRKEIGDNLAAQEKHKKQLRTALQEANKAEVLNRLPELRRLNSELTVAVAQRYHELLSEMTLPQTK